MDGTTQIGGLTYKVHLEANDVNKDGFQPAEMKHYPATSQHEELDTGDSLQITFEPVYKAGEKTPNQPDAVTFSIEEDSYGVQRHAFSNALGMDSTDRYFVDKDEPQSIGNMVRDQAVGQTDALLSKYNDR